MGGEGGGAYMASFISVARALAASLSVPQAMRRRSDSEALFGQHSILSDSEVASLLSGDHRLK